MLSKGVESIIIAFWPLFCYKGQNGPALFASCWFDPACCMVEPVKATLKDAAL